MSLQMDWNTEIPDDTARVGREILTNDDPYRLVGDGVNDFLSLKDFTGLYSELGRGAVCPIILSLITVFQFLENIPDRVAARWAVTRIDWKYALHLPLTWLGFDFSDLSNFRQRLLEHNAERLIFEKVLEWVRSLGFLKKYGKQRSDSTHILGCVERLSRLELVWETLRVTLRVIRDTAPEWYEEVLPAAFHEAYVKRQSDWRLSKEEVKAEMQKVGRDGFWLLDHLNDSTPPSILGLAEVETLRRVWNQQFERKPDSQKVKVRPPSGRGKGKDLVVTPHDPDARWSEKRGKDWIGYKLQVTETAEEEVTHQFITDIDAVAATTHDSEVVDEIQKRLIARALKPQEHYVDQGYPSGPNLAHSAGCGIELIGPVGGDTAGKPEGYRQSDFTLDFAARQATCPAGKISVAWYERPQPDGYMGAEIQFKAQCNGCPARAQCAPGKSGRTLNINPYHEILDRRRTEQETEDFQERMKRRPAIEGTISELTRKHGSRRARYRGQNKVRLQALFTGAAANLKRLARALAAKEGPIAKGMATC
jgi:transposase/IS5 family transposase